MKKVVIVNHGKVFSQSNWYTFHCPTCSSAVLNTHGVIVCGSCKCEMVFPDNVD